ncbi:TRAP transporter small permease subunit [Magnetospirillum sp. UT-4]|uniref:TRAP transporter small permease subunit n=1 Tax=Magnetospirillum sp. UT-4 TaxID=2681467 RepID=UPI0013827FDC|nr:TRAP transporter small permease subunit [Magnetospirillum sp. UT-4]CAA7618053.1 TRAP-type mannitol/chloroaromatic compound transport system, small permease component [Magnetospirillum sp. UT-4]
MTLLLGVSGMIDRMNAAIGRLVYWLVLIMVVVSSANAMMRYLFNISSNAWLEIQWYLFSAVFLLCAGYTHLRNEHIRIDVVTGRFSRRVQTWIDIIGGVFFLLPMALILTVLSWPLAVEAFHNGEMSSDPGGLIRWPVKVLIPLGFTLLALQGLSETIKRAAFLLGRGPDPGVKHGGAHAPAVGGQT